MLMKNRILKVRNLMEERKLDGILIEDPTNVYYLSNFTGSTCSVFISATSATVLVDFRYIEQAKKQCVGFDVVVYDQSFEQFMKSLNELLYQDDVHRVGFDGSNMVFDRVTKIKETLDATLLSVNLIALRSIKDESELKKIKDAVEVGDAVFADVYLNIESGMKETDVVSMMQNALKKRGASDFSFGTIVASGERSSMPHGVASDKLIESSDIVTVDWGIILDHYCSDCTRTFFMKEPTNEKLVDMYNTVLKANQAAIAAVKAGVSTKVVDQVARDVVAKAGYGDYFNHGTGHGVGIDIHEYPRLNPFTDVMLETNMVITIEPGIYIEGVGGVRIEDVVVVKENGCEVLTKLNKELQYKSEGKKQ
jgi:Xaa-Pro aminopeptidase